jgi:hypothetical protein
MASILESASGGRAVDVASTVDLAPPLEAGWDPGARTLV